MDREFDLGAEISEPCEGAQARDDEQLIGIERKGQLPVRACGTERFEPRAQRRAWGEVHQRPARLLTERLELRLVEHAPGRAKDQGDGA